MASRLDARDASATTEASVHEEHGTPEGLEDLPEIPPFDEVGPVDARALSKTLFQRLETLEEGTPSTATYATRWSSSTSPW